MGFDKERAFAQKLANVFLRDDRIRIKKSNTNIAFVSVNTKEIFFNWKNIFESKSKTLSSYMTEDIFNEIMMFKGLLFHEISHLMFTVHGKGVLTHLKSKELWNLILMLEDGRVETLAVMRWEKLADYFTYAVNNILLKEKKNILNDNYESVLISYILLYGRKIYFRDYELLSNLRHALVNKFSEEFVKITEDYIDSYSFETSSLKRIKIAENLLNHLKKHMNVYKLSDWKGNLSVVIDSKLADPKTCPKSMKVLLDDLPIAEKTKQEIRDKIREMEKQLRDKLKTTKKTSKTQFEKDKKEKIQKIEQNMRQLVQKEEKMEDEVDDLESNTNKEPDEDELQEKVDELDEVREEVEDKQDELNKIRRSTVEDKHRKENVPKELDNIIDGKEEENEELIEKNMSDLASDMRELGKETEFYASDDFQVTDEMKTTAKDLEKGLKKLKSELAKGYVARQKSGRINIRSYINRKNLADTKIFSKYLPNRVKDTKLLVNIYLDGSGSMSGDRWILALDSCWIINESLNKDRNKVMAYQFSSKFAKFKDYEKPMQIPRFIGGNTHPENAINHSIEEIEKYKHARNFKNVIDIVITDGNFGNPFAVGKSIEKLNSLGHETVVLDVFGRNICSDVKFKHYVEVNDFTELTKNMVKIFGEIKKKIIRQVQVR